MVDTILLTVNDIIKFTPISNNVDPELIWPHILISQQMNIAPVLGDALYQDIMTRFDNFQLTGDTGILWEQYISPALMYSAWANASIFIAFKTQRNGLVTSSTDTLTPLSPEEMSLYLSRVNGLRDFYLNRLESYLCVNQLLFPLYRPKDSNIGQGSQIFLGFPDRPMRDPYWQQEVSELGNCDSC